MFHKLANVIENCTGITKLQFIEEKSRKAEIARAKHLFRYFLRKHGFTWKEIGRVAHCDHATAIHSYNYIDGILLYDKYIAGLVALIEGDLKCHLNL